MVHRVVPPIVFVVLVHREFRNPQEVEPVLIDQPVALAHFEPQRAERRGDGGRLSADNQNAVAGLEGGTGSQFCDFRFTQRLREG